jgi:hypothetical protein
MLQETTWGLGARRRWVWRERKEASYAVHTFTRLYQFSPALSSHRPYFTYGTHLVPDYGCRYGLTEMSLPQHKVFLLVAARRGTGALMAGRLLRSTSSL